MTCRTTTFGDIQNTLIKAFGYRTPPTKSGESEQADALPGGRDEDESRWAAGWQTDTAAVIVTAAPEPARTAGPNHHRGLGVGVRGRG